MSQDMFIPLGDVVVLRKLEEEERTSSSGVIFVPESASDMRYVVVDVGPGRRGLLDGKLVPTIVQKGWIVVLSSEPAPVQIPGKNLFYTSESDCLAAVGKV